MHSRQFAAIFCAVASLISTSAIAGTLRIADWNIEDDIDGYTAPRAGLNTVLQGIGNEIIQGDTQPLDILALEETTSNADSVDPILTDLNDDYPGADYLTSSYQATQDGENSDGNGPNAIVYNSKTVTLLATVGVGTPEGSENGEYRQVVRYEFEPVGGSSPFYVYVSHMKSGTTSADATDRGEEATIIRDNEATLPANASVLYVGDLNSNPPEAEFTEFTAAGQGEAYDPVDFSAFSEYYTESATDLEYRDDYQLMTDNVLTGTGAINYVSGSLQSFGNNGETPVGGDVDSPSNTDLAYMTTANGYSPTQSQILSALTTASDHLPNVADYTFVPMPVPEPTSIALISGGAALLLARRRRNNR